MASQSHDDLKSQFKNICGVDDDRADFFLEAAGWDISIAVREFFNDNENASNADADVEANPASTKPSGRPPRSEGERSGSSNNRFVSMANFRSRDESESEEEEGEAFYVGGSEKGAGQQVLGPPKKKASEIAQQMFASAMEHGATPVDVEPTPTAGASGRVAFTGVGYKLGDDMTTPSEVVSGRAAPIRQPTRVDRVLKLWRDGFSVDDGPPRSYSDAENREFLDSVRRGEIPEELLRDAKGGEVNLNMEDHRDEQYVPPPKAKLVAFSGTGYVLGSPAPNTSDQPAAEPVPSEAVTPAVTVDSSQPTAPIHVRLDDGSRLSLNMNLTHTIADIRQQIVSERPQYSNSTFTLQTNFPKRELTDLSETVEKANLKNSCIMLRTQRG